MITAYLIGIWSGDLYVRFALMIVAAGVFVAYFAVAIWRGRHHAVRAFLAAGAGAPEAPWGMRLLAQSWAPLIIVYVVAMYARDRHRCLGRGNGQRGVLPGGRSCRGRGNTDCRLSRRPPHVPARPAPRRPASERRGRRIASSGGPAGSSFSCSQCCSCFTCSASTSSPVRKTGSARGSRRLVFDVGVVVLVAYVFWELAIAAINRKLVEDNARRCTRGNRRDQGEPIDDPAAALSTGAADRDRRHRRPDDPLLARRRISARCSPAPGSSAWPSASARRPSSRT